MQPSTIGPFTIERELGRGGMGEVYLARDTRLDRQVAIKALPVHLALDADRLARFQREAKVLASLNHSNIGAIYGLEELAGHQYLILEYVEGETLADRLVRGAVPVDEALSIAKQIAEALEVAHEKGVIHRDLKPGNVMVTADSVVKVLDFGLARTADGAPSTSGAMHALDESPTITSPARINSPTIPGVILGTAGYMSPEQARGKPVDKRSDIFSFGCVLYEMLTGIGPFPGETVTDSLGAILYREPDWNAIPPGTPSAIVRLLRRCLAKDRRERLRDIGDARLELANVSLIGEAVETIAAPSSKPARWIALGLAAGLIVASAGFAIMRSVRGTPPDAATVVAPLMHLSIPMPSLGEIDAPLFAVPSVNITPDGRSVVFVATDGTSYEAFKRQLNSTESTRFFGEDTLILSPDSRWMAFLDENMDYAKVPLSGGVPTPLCDAQAEVRGGCWLDDGTLVVTLSTESGLWRFSESGGEPTPLTEVDRAAGELSHRWPEAIPGARGVLYVVKTSRMDSFDQADIWVHDLKTGTRKRLVTGGSMPRYIPETPDTGIIVFGRDDHLWAVRLDLPSLTVIGVPVEVWKNVPLSPERGIVGYAIAREAGTLVYVNTDRSFDQSELVWVDSATGKETPVGAAPGLYVTPSIGPSGEIAVGVMAANDYITLIDDRGVSRRLTRGSNIMDPVWTAAGNEMFCRDSQGRVQRMPIANPERLTPVPGLEQFERVTSCSADGQWMLFERPANGSSYDIWKQEVDGTSQATVVLATPDDEGEAVFSPDDKRIAYTQIQNGTPQVFVMNFPATGQGLQVSINGGENPQWSADGREVYFRYGNDVFAAAIPADGSRPESPRVLFTGPYTMMNTYYARGVQDGRFLMIRRIKNPPTHLDVVLNWTADVKRKLDAANP